MDHCGGKAQEGAENVGYVADDLVTGNVKHESVRDIFQDGGSGGSSFWVRDVGDYPPHGTGSGISRTGWTVISQKYIHGNFRK